MNKSDQLQYIAVMLYTVKFQLRFCKAVKLCRLGWWVGLARRTVLPGGDDPQREEAIFGKHVPDKPNIL